MYGRNKASSIYDGGIDTFFHIMVSASRKLYAGGINTKNHHLVQFDETICFFKLMVNVRLYRRLFSYGCLLWFNAMVHGAGLSVSDTSDLSRPSDSEGIGNLEEADGRRSTTVGSEASDGGQVQPVSKQGAPAT